MQIEAGENALCEKKVAEERSVEHVLTGGGGDKMGV